MPDMLVSEYEAEVRRVVSVLDKRTGLVTVSVGRDDTEIDIRYVHPLPQPISLTIGLNPDGKDGYCLVPRLRVGSSSGLQGDPVVAQAQIDAMQEAMRVGRAAYSMLENVRVWIRDAPCDRCSGRGTSGARPCAACDGKGVRNSS